MNKKHIIKSINIIETELSSFDTDKKEIKNILETDKIKLIKEVKSGIFDDMLNEIEEREKNKKKETFWNKLFKII
jgi:hypothetical protein